MKFTMRYEVRIPTNLCEVDIDEEKIKEDFGSVENFILWTKKTKYPKGKKFTKSWEKSPTSIGYDYDFLWI